MELVRCIVQFLSVACYIYCGGRADHCENVLKAAMSLWNLHLQSMVAYLISFDK
jgi:hypothetical protein